MFEDRRPKMTYQQALWFLKRMINETDKIPLDDITVDTTVSREAFIKFWRLLKTRITPEPRTPAGLAWFSSTTVASLLQTFEFEPEPA
ncbi:MAG: hypothetical protein WC050_04285 [Candidatus Paceibacterota bacterium]